MTAPPMPGLADLPPPPPGRTGWPWTEAPPPVPPTMPDGRRFDQDPYTEETLRSVLLQGYPNLEYVVMDGGATDGSAAIVERDRHGLV